MCFVILCVGFGPMWFKAKRQIQYILQQHRHYGFLSPKCMKLLLFVSTSTTIWSLGVRDKHRRSFYLARRSSASSITQREATGLWFISNQRFQQLCGLWNMDHTVPLTGNVASYAVETHQNTHTDTWTCHILFIQTTAHTGHVTYPV